MNCIPKLWLFVLLMLMSLASAQTTAFFRISATDANTEILNLHKWGVLVWSNQIASPPIYTIQSSQTLDGPWTNMNNGYPVVGNSNIFSQIVVPELPPTNNYETGEIFVTFDIALSGGGGSSICFRTDGNRCVGWHVDRTCIKRPGSRVVRNTRKRSKCVTG